MEYLKILHWIQYQFIFPSSLPIQCFFLYKLPYRIIMAYFWWFLSMFLTVPFNLINYRTFINLLSSTIVSSKYLAKFLMNSKLGNRFIESGISSKAIIGAMVKKITWILCWKFIYSGLWGAWWFTCCSRRRYAMQFLINAKFHYNST